MANKLGLLQRLSAQVSRLLNAKELVGLDANGNKYYRQAYHYISRSSVPL